MRVAAREPPSRSSLPQLPGTYLFVQAHYDVAAAMRIPARVAVCNVVAGTGVPPDTGSSL